MEVTTIKVSVDTRDKMKVLLAMEGINSYNEYLTKIIDKLYEEKMKELRNGN